MLYINEYFFSVVIEIEPDQDEKAKGYTFSDFEYDNYMFFGDFVAYSEAEMNEILEDAKANFSSEGFDIVDAYTEIINKQKWSRK